MGSVRVTHLTESTSTAEEPVSNISLVLEFNVDVSSTTLLLDSGPSIGGPITELFGIRALCSDLTTQENVVIDLMGADSWDCEAAGLDVNSGDRIRIVAVGRALSASVAGSVTGFTPWWTVCRDIRTGQQVIIILIGSRSFHCEAAGLVVTPGVPVQTIVVGELE